MSILESGLEAWRWDGAELSGLPRTNVADLWKFDAPGDIVAS
jgi:hypothetical protein